MMAKDPKIDIWSLDECHFQQHGTRCTMWVPPEEKDPILLHPPTRKSMALFGAVNLMTGKLVHTANPIFNAETFLAFLKKLMRHKSKKRKTAVILDNARYHHAVLLKPWLEKHREKFQLEFLPPYSPELNPIERVWKLTRKLCTHNQYFPRLEELVQAVSGQLSLWNKPNGTLYKLCCIN
ncbi:MAG: IS630 family transposase [Bacteroidetes bacterium]|nr:IS630 family transposase [Bacteroidota bacterium]